MNRYPRNWTWLAMLVALCMAVGLGTAFAAPGGGGGKEKGAGACSDLIDNDNDGNIDCADSDCTGQTLCEYPEVSCSDGFDNDGDGAIDGADSDCQGGCVPTGTPETVCNGVDDDCDTLIDEDYVTTPTNCGVGECAASGQIECQGGSEVDTCTPGAPGTEGPAGDATCTDTLDNDCDGTTDAMDSGCTGAPQEICNNGIDDDGDTLVDCDDLLDCSNDPACNLPTVENCSNGIDDDGDGLIDCADSDCIGNAACTNGQHAFNILMNYELGMHCTGFEFAYCCVLPPYNSILAQVVKTEKTATFPRLLEADHVNGVDGLGRPTVLRDKELNGNGGFKKYQLRYWHEAQPRNDGAGAPQTSTLISVAEGNSLLMWNTVAEGATTTAGGALVYNGSDGSTNVVQGDGDFADANDNYWNAVWNHLYIYQDLEGSNPTANVSAEADKVRLGINVIYPENTGAALHPLGPGVVGAGFDNVLTFSGDTGTVVYTQMKVLENLPVMLTSPRIWEALGLPLTPFEDTINFFADPGAVDEDSIRPYVLMKAQLEEYPSGNAVMDNGEPVIGFGTAPIDIPNCERCHSLGDGVSVNSAQNGHGAVDVMVQDEIDFWNTYYGINTGAGDSDWYSRLKGAAISILAIHDAEHGTSFTANWPVAAPMGSEPHATRLGHGSVICQRCHADNVIAVVKSADCGPGQNCDSNDPRNELFSNIAASGTALIKPLTEALHNNHKNNPFSDSLGRSGGCQGCHPAHRSDGDMSSYPITELGLNGFAGSDNRDAAGGCFVGRDVHSNPGKDTDGAETPEHLNAVGQWLQDNVSSDTGTWKGIWCTNCHSQLGQEMWKTENCADLINGDCITNPRGEPTLAAVAAAVGVTEAQAIAWLDPKTDADMATIWNEDPGMCNHAASLLGLATASTDQDGNVATIEINLQDGNSCSAGYVGVPGPDCGTNPGNPSFWICIKQDVDGDVNVHLMDFCTTADCVAAAQATLIGPGQAAVPVPMSAATDGRDHWLAPGEPHCADCHAAPYVEQSGNITAYPPFNYPRKASLFRYTRGHQDISCQGCHESIHGLYPVTPNIDTTTYNQAAHLNADGSHGPLKCSACHDAPASGAPNWMAAGGYFDTNNILNNYDNAVTWAHTYTDEADPTQSVCLNCHASHTDVLSSSNSKWTNHAKVGRVSRDTMDKAEIVVLGHVAGDPAFESPYNTVCTSCHGDRSNTLSRRGCTDKWRNHLIEGRASEKVWEYISIDQTGGTCGW